MRSQPHEDRRVHEAVHVLLPWYANGTLTGQELAQVTTHLDTCVACQIDLAQCRDLGATLQSMPAPAWSPTPAHVARVLARIEASEARRTRLRDWYDTLAAWGQACRELLQSTPHAIRWTLAAQAALLLVLASLWVLQPPWPAPGQYHTLSDGTNQAAPWPHQAAIRVVFAGDTTVDEIRILLTSIGGTMVGGPSPLGVYTVGLPLAGERLMRLEAGLNALRAHPKVRLAEPLGTR